MENQDVTTRELAKKAGVGTETVWKIRNGKFEHCAFNSLLKIAKVLNVKIKDLFDEIDEK